MRELSEATQEKLEPLWAWEAAGAEVAADEVARRIAEVGEAGEAVTIPSLARFMYVSAGKVAQAAARAIDVVADNCTPLELDELDEVVRHSGNERAGRVRPEDVVSLSQGLVGTLGILSYNESGYVRQGAVEALAEVRSGREVPFLLIRLNDWVEEVRAVARRAVEERISAEWVGALVWCLPLLDRVRRRGGGAQEEIVTKILKLLSKPEHRAVVAAAVLSEEREMRRRAFELLVAEPSVEDVVLLERCLESADTLIRFGAARELCKRLEGAALAEMLERLWTNRSMPLRREALYATLKRMPEVAVARLREALVDTNVSIREMGRSYLREKRENPSENFAEYYGRRLGNAHGAELEGTILGLGETGKDVDAQRVEEFLKHASARVRRAAVRAVARLDIERYGEWVMNALGDEAVTVTRAARDVLLAAPRVLCGKKLWEIVEGTESIEVRRSALSLIAELQWWESASLLLKALRLNDETRGLALSHLEGWQYNAHRLMVMPSWEQVELIEDGLKRHGAQLSKALREDLESLIAYVRREKVRWR